MKRNVFALSFLLAVGFYACQKNNSDASRISLTPSATQATVGQTVSVSLSANASASSWTVSPSSTATKTYGLTTGKVNYFTFSQAGTYTVSVRTKNLSGDTASLAANRNATRDAGCTKGVDTASVAITVSGK